MSRPAIPRICQNCNRGFLADKHDMNRGFGRFCSIGCANSARSGAPRRPSVNRRPQLSRVLSKDQLIIEKSQPVPHCGCWIYDGVPNKDGYGQIRYRGTRMSAHRFSWMAFNKQEIPEGMEVMHMCDTPICVNPDHLRLGTHAENMADRSRKGRRNFGKKGRLTMRTKAEVVRSVRNDKGTLKEIAQRHGLSTGCVYNIRAHKIPSYEGI